jgi:hypothetical protein
MATIKMTAITGDTPLSLEIFLRGFFPGKIGLSLMGLFMV